MREEGLGFKGGGIRGKGGGIRDKGLVMRGEVRGKKEELKNDRRGVRE